MRLGIHGTRRSLLICFVFIRAVPVIAATAAQDGHGSKTRGIYDNGVFTVSSRRNRPSHLPPGINSFLGKHHKIDSVLIEVPRYNSTSDDASRLNPLFRSSQRTLIPSSSTNTIPNHVKLFIVDSLRKNDMSSSMQQPHLTFDPSRDTSNVQAAQKFFVLKRGRLTIPSYVHSTATTPSNDPRLVSGNKSHSFIVAINRDDAGGTVTQRSRASLVPVMGLMEETGKKNEGRGSEEPRLKEEGQTLKTFIMKETTPVESQNSTEELLRRKRGEVVLTLIGIWLEFFSELLSTLPTKLTAILTVFKT